jgi:CheY-like chemotaxis protein
MTLILQDVGYQVTVANSVQQTCALLKTDLFDLVLADNFTFHDDASMTETGPIRQAAGATPVVLCTADRITPEQATAAGFRGLITKPFELNSLLEQVRTLLGG